MLELMSTLPYQSSTHLLSTLTLLLSHRNSDYQNNNEFLNNFNKW